MNKNLWQVWLPEIKIKRKRTQSGFFEKIKIVFFYPCGYYSGNYLR